MKANKDLIIIYVVATINILLFLICTDVCLYPDTGSYIDAALYLREGKIHPLRTPVYPIYLGVMRMLFGQGLYMKTAVVIQSLVFLLSIWYFYKAALKIINSNKISFWLSLFYAVCTGTFTWFDTILTETFALSGSVILLHYTLCLYEKYSVKSMLQVTTLLVFLTLLRPAFVYLIPVMVIVWAMSFKSGKRKESIGGFVGVGVTVIVLCSYMLLFQHSYGIFATSRVNIQNRESNYRAYGLYNPDVISDASFKADIEESYKKYGQRPDIDYSNYYKNEVIAGWGIITKKYSFSTRQEALNKSLLSHPLKNLVSVGGRVVRAADKNVFANYAKRGGGMYNAFANYLALFNVKLMYLYTLLIIYFVVFLCCLCQRKQMAWYSMTLFLIGVANLFTAVIGAQEEWPRLILPSIPIYIIMFGQLCSFFYFKFDKELK